jgi:hypothetical protein
LDVNDTACIVGRVIAPENSIGDIDRDGAAEAAIGEKHTALLGGANALKQCHAGAAGRAWADFK